MLFDVLSPETCGLKGGVICGFCQRLMLVCVGFGAGGLDEQSCEDVEDS